MAIRRSASRVKFPSRTKHGARYKKAKFVLVDQLPPSVEEPAAETALPKGKKAPQRTKPKLHIFLGRSEGDSARHRDTGAGADVTWTNQAVSFPKKSILTVDDLASCGQLRTELRLTYTVTEGTVPNLDHAADNDCAIWSDDDCAVEEDNDCAILDDNEDCAIVDDEGCAVVEDDHTAVEDTHTIADNDDCAILSDSDDDDDDDYDGSPPASLLVEASLYEPSEDGFEDPVETQTPISPSPLQTRPPALTPTSTSTPKPFLQTLVQLFAGRKKQGTKKQRNNALPAPTVTDEPETQDTAPEQLKQQCPPLPIRKITIASVVPSVIHPSFKNPSKCRRYVDVQPAPNHISIGDARVAPATFVPDIVMVGFPKYETKSQSQSTSTQPKSDTKNDAAQMKGNTTDEAPAREEVHEQDEVTDQDETSGREEVPAQDDTSDQKEVSHNNASDASIFDREHEAWKIWGAKFTRFEELQAQRECPVAGDFWITLAEPGVEHEW